MQGCKLGRMEGSWHAVQFDAVDLSARKGSRPSPLSAPESTAQAPVLTGAHDSEQQCLAGMVMFCTALGWQVCPSSTEVLSSATSLAGQAPTGWPTRGTSSPPPPGLRTAPAATQWCTSWRGSSSQVWQGPHAGAAGATEPGAQWPW